MFVLRFSDGTFVTTKNSRHSNTADLHKARVFHRKCDASNSIYLYSTAYADDRPELVPVELTIKETQDL